MDECIKISWNGVVFKKYTQQELINELYRYIDENDRIPRCSDMCGDNGYISYTIYFKYFSSWEDALNIAGIDTGGYTNDYLISKLKELAAKHNGVVTQDLVVQSKDMPMCSTYIRHFGSWVDALKSANLEYDWMYKHRDEDATCSKCAGSTIRWYFDSEFNVICASCYNKTWKKNNPDKCLKHVHKRRGYGFTPINNKSVAHDAHHLWLESNDFTVYLPSFLHQLHGHNHNKPETMVTVNAIALDFFIQEDFYKDLYLNGGDASGTVIS